MMGRWSDQELVPDRHHVGTVVPFRRAGRRPVVRPVVFDREREQVDEVVTLSRVEARAIAGMLRAAEPHLPWRRAVADAIAQLEGER